MVSRDQKKKQAIRQAEREATQNLNSPRGAYEVPQLDECPDAAWEAPFDDANTVRLQFLLWRDKGRLAAFVVNVQVLTPSGWVSVERFDCCHGHCHLHTDNGEPGSQSVYTLESIDDVQRAFMEVERIADERARIIRDKGV